jgi:hypothetical protein
MKRTIRSGVTKTITEIKTNNGTKRIIKSIINPDIKIKTKGRMRIKITRTTKKIKRTMTNGVANTAK